MRSVFTTFASSRFVDREAVVEALRECAQALKTRRGEVVAVHLFGSFADGTATPRSDADIVVEIADAALEVRREVREAAVDAFLEGPVPVDLFVFSEAQMEQGQGVAGVASRESVVLA